MYLDTPRDLIGQVHDDLRFGDTPLGRPIIGTKETVGAATRDTFTRLPRHLVPARAHGDRPRRCRHRRDGRRRRGPLRRPRGRANAGAAGTELPVISGPDVRIERRDSDQAHLILSVGGYPVGHPDRYVLSVLQAVLGGGMSSRLFTEVRERRGLAYYVFASHAGYTDTGSLYVQAASTPKRIELAVETIWSELRRMATETVPDGRDRQGQALPDGPHRARRRGRAGMILHGLRRALIEGEPVELDEIFAGIEAVTADDIARVARRPDPPRPGRAAVIGPFDEAEGLRGAIGED